MSKKIGRRLKHKYFDGTVDDNIPMGGRNGSALKEFTCRYCGFNIRFDPRYNFL